MPATAGRVRMPANNRVHSSAALQTHGIWQSAIKYDPYAPKDDGKDASLPKSSNSEPESENAYASFQGLLALARMNMSNADEARGACKKCGRVGHLTFQCRNFLSAKDDSKEKDPEEIPADILSELDKLKRNAGKANGKMAVETSEDSDEDDSESSDSDADSEIERIIAQRYGKKGSGKGRSLRKKRASDEKGSDTDSVERKKRGRSKKRSGKRGSGNSGDSDGGRKKRKEKRRKRDESSDEDDERQRRRHRKSRKETRRRRSHRYSDDSDSDSDVSEHSGRERKRKSMRAASPSDSNALDDSRVGRGKKRSEAKSRKRHHEHDE